MTEATFSGTNAQLVNALNHMATERPLTLQERAIVAAAAKRIAHMVGLPALSPEATVAATVPPQEVSMQEAISAIVGSMVTPNPCFTPEDEAYNAGLDEACAALRALSEKLEGSAECS